MSGLRQFREEGDDAPPRPLSTLLPDPDAPQRILGVDQSLAGTGWAFVVCGEAFEVRQTGMIKTPPGDGFESSFQRGVNLYERLCRVVYQYRPALVVHEMPAVRKGRRSKKEEAGPIAAMAVRIAAHETGVPLLMLSAQHVRGRLLGHSGADKHAVRAGIEQLCKGVSRSLLDYYNDDVFDAAALAVVAGAAR